MKDSILIAEDDLNDQRFIKMALAKVSTDVEIKLVKDGEEALVELKSDALPRLIVLDINMPRLDGKSVLKQVKADQRLRRIPIVMFSTADNQSEIADCYDLHANAYVIKPDTLDGYRRVALRLKEFWLDEAAIAI